MASTFKDPVHAGYELLDELDLSAAALHIALRNLDRDPSVSKSAKASIERVLTILPKIRQLKGVFQGVEAGSKAYFRKLLDRHRATVAFLRPANDTSSLHGVVSRNPPDEREFFHELTVFENDFELMQAEIARQEREQERPGQQTSKGLYGHVQPKINGPVGARRPMTTRISLNYNDYPRY